MANFKATKIYPHSEGRVEFDDNSHTLIIVEKSLFRDKKYTLRYDQIKDVCVLTDEITRSSLNLGNAMVGHALFGNAGGAVGAFTNMPTKTYCSYLQLKIFLKNSNAQYAYITLLDKKVSTDSRAFKSAYYMTEGVYNHLRKAIKLSTQISREKEQEKQRKEAEERQLAKEREQKAREQRQKAREQRQKEYEQRMMEIEKEEKALEEERRKQALFYAPDQILKYKQLLDDGIITEEEFQTVKKELLNL